MTTIDLLLIIGSLAATGRNSRQRPFSRFRRDRMCHRLRLSATAPASTKLASVSTGPAITETQMPATGAPPRGPARCCVRSTLSRASVPLTLSAGRYGRCFYRSGRGSGQFPELLEGSLVLSIGAEVVPRFDLVERPLRPRLDRV